MSDQNFDFKQWNIKLKCLIVEQYRQLKQHSVHPSWCKRSRCVYFNINRILCTVFCCQTDKKRRQHKRAVKFIMRFIAQSEQPLAHWSADEIANICLFVVPFDGFSKIKSTKFIWYRNLCFAETSILVNKLRSEFTIYKM